MPRSGDLPDDLKSLLRRHALEVSHDRFNADSERLVSAVERALETARAEHQHEEEEPFDAELRERDEKERLAAVRPQRERRKREKEQLQAEQLELKEEKAPVWGTPKGRWILAVCAGVTIVVVALIVVLSQRQAKPHPYPSPTATPGASLTPVPATTPGPSQKLPLPSAPGIGILTIPNLKTRTVEVYSQDSDGVNYMRPGYAGDLSPKTTSLQVPAGTYKLKFGNYFQQNIVVKSGEENVLK